jgi:hypothetical protein
MARLIARTVQYRKVEEGVEGGGEVSDETGTLRARLFVPLDGDADGK